MLSNFKSQEISQVLGKHKDHLCMVQSRVTMRPTDSPHALCILVLYSVSCIFHFTSGLCQNDAMFL